jgi:hypothetical protein
MASEEREAGNNNGVLLQLPTRGLNSTVQGIGCQKE